MTRLLTWLLLVLAVALPVAGCGSDSEPAAASSDAAQLLRDTFAADHAIESGRLALELRAAGATLTVRGPFASQGERRVPRVALDIAAEGQGQSIQAGVVSTGEKGFLRFQGQTYAVPDQLFRSLQASLEEGQRQGAGQGLGALGIDASRWIRDPRNAGEAKVGDDAVVRVTGGVDSARLVADLDRLARRAGQLGLGSGGQARELSERERRELETALRDAKVEVFTGVEDRILRRLRVTADALTLDLTLTDVNEDQDIEEPEGARPLDELLERFGGLGALGGLGGAGGGGAQGRQWERYRECLERGTADADLRRCGERLAP